MQINESQEKLNNILLNQDNQDDCGPFDFFLASCEIVKALKTSKMDISTLFFGFMFL